MNAYCNACNRPIGLGEQFDCVWCKVYAEHLRRSWRTETAEARLEAERVEGEKAAEARLIDLAKKCQDSYAGGRADAEARIVAWLKMFPHDRKIDPHVWARSIERGEHRE